MENKFEKLHGVNLSSLHDCEVQDANGKKIGRLIDAVLKKSDSGLDLTKFIVGDSRLVEFLEKIGIRDDIDPVFSVDVVDYMNLKRVKLNVAKDQLKKTHLDDVLSDSEYKMTELSKTPVFDNSGKKIGRVVDLTFDKNKFQLILGESTITEWIESLGLQPDVDFIISPDYIKSFSRDKIELTKSKYDLKSTFKANLEKEIRGKKAQETSEMKKDQSRYYFPNRFA